MRCDLKMSAMIFADAQRLERAALFAWNMRSSEKVWRGAAPDRIGRGNFLHASTRPLRFLLAAVARRASRMAPGFRALASAAR